MDFLFQLKSPVSGRNERENRIQIRYKASGITGFVSINNPILVKGICWFDSPSNNPFFREWRPSLLEISLNSSSTWPITYIPSPISGVIIASAADDLINLQSYQAWCVRYASLYRYSFLSIFNISSIPRKIHTLESIYNHMHNYMTQISTHQAGIFTFLLPLTPSPVVRSQSSGVAVRSDKNY